MNPSSVCVFKCECAFYRPYLYYLWQSFNFLCHDLYKCKMSPCSCCAHLFCNQSATVGSWASAIKVLDLQSNSETLSVW